MRLVKFLAQFGVASRRKSEILIADGVITVNNVVVRNPATAIDIDKDVVTCNGKLVKSERELLYFALNKPTGYVTTTKDPHNLFVLELIPKKLHQRGRLYPIGRLDKESEGLIVLTNDGAVTNTITHPRYQVEKEYEVTLNKNISPEHLLQVKKGIELFDGLSKPDRIQVNQLPNKQTIISLVMHEGRKRQIRRMFKKLGYKVIKLLRTRIGQLYLGHLKSGNFRELGKHDVEKLLAQIS